MGTVAENIDAWDRHYRWTEQGDEWSAEWGGAAAQWHGSLLPRLRHFLPARTVLEIAPGLGRWTQFLAPAAQRLIAVDLSSSCIEACQQRFVDLAHIEYHVNDGRSLEMIDDDSLDFVFSFDSLVHAEQDVIADYMGELRRTLGSHGIAFLHHSNLGEYAAQLEIEDAMIDDQFSGERPGRPPRHWRAGSMSAGAFRELADQAGLSCVGQEIINWGGERLIDCISLVTQRGSRWDRESSVQRNPNFMAEAHSIRAASRVFGFAR